MLNNSAVSRPKSSQPIPPEARKVFSGIIFDVYQWPQKQFDGTYKTFEKLKRRDTVVVIPVTTDGKIIVTEQEHPGKQKFVGVAAGTVEEGEDIYAAAERELFEETGYRAKEFAIFDAVQPMSKIEWSIYTIIAKGCEKLGDIKLDSGEIIKLRLVEFEEFLHIAAETNFYDKEISIKALRAKADPDKLDELKKFFQ
jgi:ADP-ribose pyrophosphatase